MKKRKEPWLQTSSRNVQTHDNNIRQDNIWHTYMTHTDRRRPYQIQPDVQNQYTGVPYINEYNRRENYDSSEIINSSNDVLNKESIPAKPQEKTVIKKEGLYKDADSFNSDNDFNRDNACSASTSANTGTWTEAYWQKHDENPSQPSGSLFNTAGHSMGKNNSKNKSRENKLEKSLNKMLAKPVEMSKGKSLLEKMGWQGGGLGKDGSGIVEPIAPKATYAVKTMGLGHPIETTNFVKKKIIENKLEKSLNKMLAKPVEMSKGKSLLEKMGWQGGGLGKDGSGIVEPIAPKATYAVKTVGLGHPNETNNVVKKKVTKPTNKLTRKNINRPLFKANFCTNVLLNILEFVQNDTTLEMFFDTQLHDGERKRIHHIVEKIRELDNLDDFKGFKEKDLDIVKDIWIHNMYELWTLSEGNRNNRQLCLYKEAPEHVYLITPDDLKDDAKEVNNAKNEEQDNKFIPNSNEIYEISDNETESVITNHDVDVIDIKNDKDIKETYIEKMNFIKSSDNECALKEKECSEIKEVTETMLGRILDYFKEFANDAIYTEFRCLGPFNDEEVNDLKLFFDICMRKDDNESQEKIELLEFLDNSALIFDVQEDINGSMLICKSGRKQLPAQ